MSKELWRRPEKCSLDLFPDSCKEVIITALQGLPVAEYKPGITYLEPLNEEQTNILRNYLGVDFVKTPYTLQDYHNILNKLQEHTDKKKRKSDFKEEDESEEMDM